MAKTLVTASMIYPKNKSVEPYPATIVSLVPGDGPEKPPGDWEIWPNPPEGTAPIPEHPIVLPPDPPPVLPPVQPEPPHAGWNWSHAKSCWYLLYVPSEGEASPKD